MPRFPEIAGPYKALFGEVAVCPFSQVVRSEYPIRQQRTEMRIFRSPSSEKGAISSTYHSWKPNSEAPVGEAKLHGMTVNDTK